VVAGPGKVPSQDGGGTGVNRCGATPAHYLQVANAAMHLLADALDTTLANRSMHTCCRSGRRRPPHPAILKATSRPAGRRLAAYR
jgi:hypothetical protein